MPAPGACAVAGLRPRAGSTCGRRQPELVVDLAAVLVHEGGDHEHARALVAALQRPAIRLTGPAALSLVILFRWSCTVETIPGSSSMHELHARRSRSWASPVREVASRRGEVAPRVASGSGPWICPAFRAPTSLAQALLLVGVDLPVDAPVQHRPKPTAERQGERANDQAKNRPRTRATDANARARSCSAAGAYGHRSITSGGDQSSSSSPSSSSVRRTRHRRKSLRQTIVAATAVTTRRAAVAGSGTGAGATGTAVVDRALCARATVDKVLGSFIRRESLVLRTAGSGSGPPPGLRSTGAACPMKAPARRTDGGPTWIACRSPAWSPAEVGIREHDERGTLIRNPVATAEAAADGARCAHRVAPHRHGQDGHHVGAGHARRRRRRQHAHRDRLLPHDRRQ